MVVLVVVEDVADVVNPLDVVKVLDVEDVADVVVEDDEVLVFIGEDVVVVKAELDEDVELKVEVDVDVEGAPAVPDVLLVVVLGAVQPDISTIITTEISRMGEILLRIGKWRFMSIISGLSQNDTPVHIEKL